MLVVDYISRFVEISKLSSTTSFSVISALTTSSPYYPQGNGLAKRMVQTVKGLLTKSDDPHLALLVYRSTPLPWCGYSPSQLLMGRRMRTNVPMVKELLVPQLPDYQKFCQYDKEFKMSQKDNYNCWHQTHSLPPLPNDTEVWVSTEKRQVPGQVISKSDIARSYMVQTDTGNLRRNRQHLTVIPDSKQKN